MTIDQALLSVLPITRGFADELGLARFVDEYPVEQTRLADGISRASIENFKLALASVPRLMRQQQF